MRNVIAFFIKNPIWSNAIIVLTGIFGLTSLFILPHSFFPETTPKQIYVNTIYPGASPQEMEEGITIKIEQALKGLSGIEEINSNSSENSSSITITAFTNIDLEELKQEVESSVASISSYPVGAEKPIVTKQKMRGMGSMVAFLALKGPDDLFELKKLADEVEFDLRNLDDVSQLSINGLPSLEIAVEIKETDMYKYNISIDEISNAIKINNIDLSAGTIKTNEEELIIRSNSRENDAEKIKDIVVRTMPDGQKIILSDVANVRLQFSETPFKVLDSKKRMVSIIIKKLPEEDMGVISSEIEKYIVKFNNKYAAEGHNLRITFQFADMLKERISLLSVNGAFGLLLVLITLGLFLSLRLSAWVAFGIPFSMLGMIAIGVLYGMTINMISLFGMILVIGILVDDGIVIAENIYTHFQSGKSSYKAALDGTMEVLPSVFTSVLTTVIAFGVLLFIGGEMEMMEEMAFAVVACLLFSLIEAFLILPSHLASKSMLSESKEGWYKNVRNKINGGIDRVTNWYGNILTKIVSTFWGWTYVPLIFIIVIFGLTFSGVIKSTFFPNIPFDKLNLEVAFKPGEREMQTEEFLNDCMESIWEVNQDFIDKTGDTLVTNCFVGVGFTEQLGESGGHAGKIDIMLDMEGKSVSSNEIADSVRTKIGYRKDIPEKFLIGGENRWGAPIQLSLTSSNNEQLYEVTDKIKKQLESFNELKDVRDNRGVGKREIYITLKDKAKLLGFNHMSLSNQIRQAFYGDEAQRIIIGVDEVKIWVRFPKESRSTLEQLDELKIRSVNGNLYPLRELANYKIERGIVSIKHINGINNVFVYADQIDAKASTTELTQKVREKVVEGLKPLYPDVTFKFKGQAERAEKSGKSLGMMFGLAIILITIVLSLNFNSFYQARIILLVVPVGFASGILGHGLEGIQVSMLSAWGFVALLGILINDAVVLLDTFNRKIKEGWLVKEAVIYAGKARFRPIILTSITTVVGLYPLILEPSFQAQFLKPMAVAIAYGVLFGTFFILFFLPPLICFSNDLKRIRMRIWYGEKFSALEAEPAYRTMQKRAEMDIDSDFESINKHGEKPKSRIGDDDFLDGVESDNNL
jgi:multidrug efflux pump subunit AcrB